MALSFGCVLGMWAYRNSPAGGLFFVLCALTGLPAAMLTLHLHPPAMITNLERRREAAKKSARRSDPSG